MKDLARSEPIIMAGVATVMAWVLCRFCGHLTANESSSVVGVVLTATLGVARRLVTVTPDLTELSRKVLRLTALLLESMPIANPDAAVARAQAVPDDTPAADSAA